MKSRTDSHVVWLWKEGWVVNFGQNRVAFIRFDHFVRLAEMNTVIELSRLFVTVRDIVLDYRNITYYQQN